MKNKYNIPVFIDETYLRKGDFIDHYNNYYKYKFTYKRRNISDDENLFIRYGIQLSIIRK
jgi:hypothetical protein